MMNNPGVLQQEKMDLDLEIPSSLVPTDGHLRRSNSAPMINGLRFNNAQQFPQSFSHFIYMWQPYCHYGHEVNGLTSEFIISVTTPWSSREKYYAAGETAQQLWTDPTWYSMFVKVFKLVSGFLFTQIVFHRSLHHQFESPAPGFIRSNK